MKLNFFIFLSAFLFIQNIGRCQNDTLYFDAGEKNEVYKLNVASDLPITLATVGLAGYGFYSIYNKDHSTPQQIEQLNPEAVNSFDRPAINEYSVEAADASNIIFYGSIPLPLLLLADKEIRKDAAKIGFLYLETMSVLGVFYTGIPYFIDRYRPLAYNTNVPMDERVRGVQKNSFIGGHPALVATATFFMAKVYDDYHPDSGFKWALYGLAASATTTTAYLRYKGGKHFPSDLILGVGIGTLTGILVPHFHKNPLFKDPNLSLTPFTGDAHGLTLRYKL